jgi:hypothetical protein
VAQADSPDVAPTPGGAIGASPTIAPAPTTAPAATVAPVPNPTATAVLPTLPAAVDNGAVQPVHFVEGPAADKPPRGLDVKPAGENGPHTRVAPAATPTPKSLVTTPHVDNAGPVVLTAAATPAPTPTPVAIVQPARVTILSPQDCEVVGSDVVVKGVVAGLGEQQIFLGIRQANGSIYPRGEIFPNADGVWSIQLRSSREKTFDVLVVASHDAAASRLLRDQKSRDDGLAALPPGAVIGSGIVTLKRQGTIGRILHRKGANGDC